MGTFKTEERTSKRVKLDSGKLSKSIPTLAKPAPSPKGKGKNMDPIPASKTKDKGKAREEGSHLPSSFKIVTGSYEKLLYGLEGTLDFDKEKDKLQFHLKPVFIFPAHVSCIKAVAASPYGGKWLATGSADEIIKIWDLKRRKEVGGLMHHEGSITHLVFPSRSHLLSASEDGTLCLFHARDWSVLRTLRGHKGRVNAVAVHPSGKVALSVGKDKALRMWDLMRGKGVASTKLGREGEIVRWSIDGSKFAVQSGSTIDIYSTNMDLLYTVTHLSRVHDIHFCSSVDKESEVLLVGAEDGKVSVYQVPSDSKSPVVIAEMTGHTNRIKAVRILEIALPQETGRPSTIIACTVSSDGLINVYDIADIPSTPNLSPTSPEQIEPLASYDSKGTRLTCLTLADGDEEVGSADNGKRKRESDNGEDSDDDWENGWEGVGGERQGEGH